MEINLRPKPLFSGGSDKFMSVVRTLDDHDRCGRMTTTVTQENVSRVGSLIKKDTKMIYAKGPKNSIR